jgi:DNA repair protein RecO (recombination protein O)
MRSLWPSMTSNSEAPASPLVRGRLRAFAQRPVAVRHDPDMDRQSILRCPWWAGTAGMLGRRTWLTRSNLRLPSFDTAQSRLLGHVRDNIEVPTCRDEAVVLRTHRLGKADRFMTMLSRRRGRIGAVAKGVWRTSSKFGARLEPFSRINLQLAVGYTLDVITQVGSPDALGEPLTGNDPADMAGRMRLETADRLIAEEFEPALHQYQHLVGASRAVNGGTSDRPRRAMLILDSYVLRALVVAGYVPSFSNCARCCVGRPYRAFSAARGGVICEGCRPAGAARLVSETLALLGALLEGSWSETRQMPDHVAQEASGIPFAFAAWHVDRNLRSLAHVEC